MNAGDLLALADRELMMPLDQEARRTVLASWSAVLEYCRAAMAFADKEQSPVNNMLVISNR